LSLASTAFDSILAARVIHKYPAHRLSREGKEMAAVAPTRGILANELQIRLMHQRGCLKRVTGILTSKQRPSHLAQLVVYRRQLPISGCLLGQSIGPQRRQECSEVAL